MRPVTPPVEASLMMLHCRSHLPDPQSEIVEAVASELQARSACGLGFLARGNTSSSRSRVIDLFLLGRLREQHLLSGGAGSDSKSIGDFSPRPTALYLAWGPARFGLAMVEPGCCLRRPRRSEPDGRTLADWASALHPGPAAARRAWDLYPAQRGGGGRTRQCVLGIGGDLDHSEAHGPAGGGPVQRPLRS